MITFRELKNILSVNTYTLTVNYGCDYEEFSSLDLATDNDLYNSFNDCTVESVDIYEDPADNKIILHSLNYDDETGLYSDSVTNEILPDHIQDEIKKYNKGGVKHDK